MITKRDIPYPLENANINMEKYVTEQTVITSRNKHVDKLNDKLIVVFPGERNKLVVDFAEYDTKN